MTRNLFSREWRSGFTMPEVLTVVLILAILILILFQVSRSFFQQYLKLENAMAITSEVGVFFAALGEDVLVATGDTKKPDELFRISNVGSDSWSLSFFKFVDDHQEPVEYRQSGQEIHRIIKGKTSRFRFAGQVRLEHLEFCFFNSPSGRGNRAWLEVAMSVESETLGGVVKGNHVRLSRNFFPTFFCRSLNSVWIDNTSHAVSTK